MFPQCTLELRRQAQERLASARDETQAHAFGDASVALSPKRTLAYAMALGWARACGIELTEELTPAQALEVCKEIPQALEPVRQTFIAVMRDWSRMLIERDEAQLTEQCLFPLQTAMACSFALDEAERVLTGAETERDWDAADRACSDFQNLLFRHRVALSLVGEDPSLKVWRETFAENSVRFFWLRETLAEIALKLHRERVTSSLLNPGSGNAVAQIRLTPWVEAAAETSSPPPEAPLHFRAPDGSWALELQFPVHYRPDAPVTGILFDTMTQQPWPETSIRINGGEGIPIKNGAIVVPLSEILPVAEGPLFVEVLSGGVWELGHLHA